MTKNGQPSEESLQRWAKIDDTIRKTEVLLFGFETSKMTQAEQNAVDESFLRRMELEAERERRTPSRELSKAERLEQRRAELILAKKMKKLDDFDRRNGVKPRKQKGGF